MKKMLTTCLILITLFFTGTDTRADDAIKPRLVTVNAMGEVDIQPDILLLSIGFVTTDKDLSDAKKENDKKVDEVLKILARYNIESKDIQTSQINIQPQYDYQKRPPLIRGYMVSNTLNIKLRDLSQFDKILEKTVTAGSNQLNGIQFDVDKKEAHQKEARRMAVAKAKEKAEEMVTQLGQKLGRPYTIEEINTQWGMPQPQMMRAKMMMMETSADSSMETLAQGEVTISSQVQISFEIEN